MRWVSEPTTLTEERTHVTKNTPRNTPKKHRRGATHLRSIITHRHLTEPGNSLLEYELPRSSRELCSPLDDDRGAVEVRHRASTHAYGWHRVGRIALHFATTGPLPFSLVPLRLDDRGHGALQGLFCSNAVAHERDLRNPASDS